MVNFTFETMKIRLITSKNEFYEVGTTIALTKPSDVVSIWRYNMIQDKTVINLLEKAMTAEGLRQQAVASNIANMNTEGYRRVDVNFEKALTKAMSKNENPSGDDVKMEFYETKNSPLNEFGNDVNIDNEVGEMVKNSLKHQTFMSLLRKKYQQMDNALKIQ